MAALLEKYATDPEAEEEGASKQGRPAPPADARGGSGGAPMGGAGRRVEEPQGGVLRTPLHPPLPAPPPAPAPQPSALLVQGKGSSQQGATGGKPGGKPSQGRVAPRVPLAPLVAPRQLPAASSTGVLEVRGKQATANPQRPPT